MIGKFYLGNINYLIVYKRFKIDIINWYVNIDEGGFIRF